MTSSAAEAIARGLADAGCRHAFGMPGGEVLTLLHALTGAGIEFTLCKHENAAGFMAEGTWAATGAPGILLTTIGPGLANAVNSIANAFLEQVPLIVLSGRVGPAEAEGFTHQVIDQSALLAPITKARFCVADGTAGTVIGKALAIARSDPPGPVHIDLPYDLADNPVEAVPGSAMPDSGAWPDSASRSGAVQMLEASDRPILVAGLGAVHHQAGRAILEMAETFSMPVVTTYKAKGIIDENHPLCLGGHGLSLLSDTCVLPLLAASDCIVLAGYDPIEMRSGWRRPWAASCAIDITHAPCHHGMHDSRFAFSGDVAGAIATLSDNAGPGARSWPGGEPDKAARALADAFAAPDRWGPHQAFDTLRNTLPDDAVVTVDSGAHRILLSQMWRCRQPRTLLQSTAFCTMGVGVPLAAGYARAAPDATVVAVVGDAGLEMVIGELATMRDHGICVVVMVMVDESLALIDLKQHRSGLPNMGVDFGATDFVALAKVYGGRGARADSPQSLAMHLEAAFSADTFTIIACPVDKSDYDGAF